MMGKEIPLIERAEIAIDPGRSQRRSAALQVAGVQHDLGTADFSRRADRGKPFEPLDSHAVRFAGQRLLGMRAQRLLPRPVGVLLDELGKVGKPSRCTGTGIIHPAQDLER